ncbi:MAG: deoxyribodipyrimidine photolyase [Planctomycetes bacterium]|nr:deoxyribodipyrimidine photolyase [Planctomycetota bacterium]
MDSVPALRVRAENRAAVRPDGAFVLYWMIAHRRPGWNFALQRAVDWARELGRPLLVLETLRSDHRWASDRLHAFVLGGMADNAAAFARKPVLHHAYVEPDPGAGRGLLAALGGEACVVVTDEFPAYFLPRMVRAAAERVAVRLESVDANGLLPLRAADQAHSRAYLFRRFLQKSLRRHLLERPLPDPLAGVRLPRLARVPEALRRRWPATAAAELRAPAALLATLPIDHTVAPVSGTPGGARAGAARLAHFLRDGLPRYADERGDPAADVASGLSPYLHFGHVGTHQILDALSARDGWTPARIEGTVTGKSSGWWGMERNAEAFLDELVTWRELGYTCAALRPDHASYASLPEWAKATLAAHAKDARTHVYDLDTFAAARTHDPIWNAAQTQLLREGRIHNYLRMLWGKKVLEWSASPEHAAQILIELNDRYALDGRDPNSYSGIYWCLGRFDRPWAPQRPVYGSIRYMSSGNTARKFRLAGYLARYAPAVESRPDRPRQGLLPG